MYFPKTSDFENTVILLDGLTAPSFDRVLREISRSEIEGPRSNNSGAIKLARSVELMDPAEVA